jgi:excisionase family DNA binding protein
MSTADDPIWDVHDVARYLKIRPATVYHKTWAPELPRIKIGNRLRFRKSAVDQMIAQRERVPEKVVFQTPFQNARARFRSLTTEKNDIHESTSRGMKR